MYVCPHNHDDAVSPTCSITCLLLSIHRASLEGKEGKKKGGGHNHDDGASVAPGAKRQNSGLPISDTENALSSQGPKMQGERPKGGVRFAGSDEVRLFVFIIIIKTCSFVRKACMHTAAPHLLLCEPG